MGKKTFLASLLMGAMASVASAQLKFNYSNLILKDLEQMGQYVSSKLKTYEQDTTSTLPLKDAVEYVFSRPDDDGLIDKLLPPVRQQLAAAEEWHKVLVQLTNACITITKDPDKHKVREQITALVMLENIIAEVKPDAKEAGLERDLLKKIADADISVSRKARSERKLRSMKGFRSPSEIAERVLDELDDTLAQEKKKAKEETKKKEKEEKRKEKEAKKEVKKKAEKSGDEQKSDDPPLEDATKADGEIEDIKIYD